MIGYLKQLEKIDGILKERLDALNVIRNTSIKKYGMKEMPISQEEKDMSIKNVNRIYDKKIQQVYDRVNHQLVLEGKEKLINPFERNEG